MNKSNVLSLTYKVAPKISILYFILTIISAFMSTVVSTYATAYFVDYALEILNRNGPTEKIYLPLIIMLFVLFFAYVTTPIINLVKKWLLLSIKKKYTPFILEKQAKLNYVNIENKEKYELISRVTGNPEEHFVNGFSSIMTIITMIIYILSVLGMIITHVWWAAILILFFSIPMIKLSIVTGRKSYQATCETEKLQRQISYLEGILSERENVDERTVFGYGDEISNRWWKIYNKGCKKKLKTHAKYMMLTKSSTMGLSLIAIFAAIALLSSVLNGNITPGLYMGLIGTILSVTHQMGWNMSWAVETIANTGEYLKEYHQFFELDSDDNNLKAPNSSPVNFVGIEFKNVSFKYPGDSKYILKNISFKIVKGHHYAIVGSNGAGKTTITKLLMGLYTDYDGEILINNIEIRKYSKDVLKSFFSNIHQDFARYAISLKDNILIGNIGRDCNDDKLNDVIKSANLEDIVNSLDNRLDTALGKIKENGRELSTGQWQRIAIARSLISDAPLKIFDEPTASLDPIAESNIYSELKKLMRGNTTILISHRLGSTKIMNEIMVIDDGCIVEHGTHDELMSLKGKYYSMFEKQRRWYQ